MAQKEFAVGEKVFAKEPGNPHWPAKVLEKAAGDDGRYRIIYYGSQKESTVMWFQLFKYNKKSKDKYVRKYERRYTHALVEMDADGRGNPEVEFKLRGKEYQEEVVVDWIIPDFKKLYKTAKMEKEVIIAKKKFGAGDKLGTTNWEMTLQRSKKDVEIHLKAIEPAKTVFAKYSVSLKSSADEFFTTANVALRKYRRGTDSSVIKSWKTMSELQNDDCLPNRELHLRLTLTLYAPPTTDNMTKELSTYIKDELDSEVGSDVIFMFPDEHGARNILAHKAILSLRSPAFAAIFMTRKVKDEVRIYDISSKAMRIILKFIYSGEVDEEWGSVAEEILYGAEKYELAQLELFWNKNVAKILTVENVMKIRSVASHRNLSDVLKSTMKFIKKDFVDKQKPAVKRRR